MNKKLLISLVSVLILVAAAALLLYHPLDSGIVAVTAAADAEEPAEPSPVDQVKDQPFLVQITDSDPSIAYVLVRMPNPIGLLPLPLEGEYTKTIRRTMDDGTEYINVLHLTPEGFWKVR